MIDEPVNPELTDHLLRLGLSLLAGNQAFQICLAVLVEQGGFYLMNGFFGKLGKGISGLFVAEDGGKGMGRDGHETLLGYHAQSNIKEINLQR